MIMDRIFEAVLLVVALNTGVDLIGGRQSASDGPTPRTLLRSNSFPFVAVLITAVLVAGVVTELVWSGALDALRADSTAGQWWRTCTAPFVQDGGVTGAIFNIVSAALVLALAEWYWGRLTAVAIWLLGAWAPIGHLAQILGYRVSGVDASAYSAGSSGATYFTAATLCAALLLGGVGRARLLGLVGPLIAALMWIVLNDGHGVVFVEGFALGLVLYVALGALRKARGWPAQTFVSSRSCRCRSICGM